MEFVVHRLEDEPIEHRTVEVVERKGLGHPDSICDAVAEELSLALSRHYLRRFDTVLHHNVDKVLLRGGAARPAFGGGAVLEPIEIYLAGRAVIDVHGSPVFVDRIAEEVTKRWLGEHLHALDPERHVLVRSLVRPGSADLQELFVRRPQQGTMRLANDTSCGVGYAPLSELEQVVLAVERHLNSSKVKELHPAIGEDVKIMGLRRGDTVQLTVSCAMVDRHLADMVEYEAIKQRVGELALAAARPLTRRDLMVEVNTADDVERKSVFLTVTGTSAEAGDDGEAGRGNRANGLITPCRRMSMESVAGKNPVTHVGKLYNLIAGSMAREIVEELPEVSEARCMLVSQIGRPIADPRLAEVELRCEARRVHALTGRVETIVRRRLGAIHLLWQEILEGRLPADAVHAVP